MIILDYETKYHKQIIHSCVQALEEGKAVVYPTDTSYGLAVDATNIKAIGRLYKIKGRGFSKPLHVIVPTVALAKKTAAWNKSAEKLSKKFWPGALTMVLPVGKGLGPSRKKQTRILSSGSGFIGLRYPKNQIALDLAKHLKRPITATSANVSGEADNYDAKEVVSRFRQRKNKPDIIISAGKLRKRKPSTVVKITPDRIEILRQGPIKEKQIKSALRA